MLHWKPEGRYRQRLYTAIAPFWSPAEHLWTALTLFWLSTDDTYLAVTVNLRDRSKLLKKISVSDKMSQFGLNFFLTFEWGGFESNLRHYALSKWCQKGLKNVSKRDLGGFREQAPPPPYLLVIFLISYIVKTLN